MIIRLFKERLATEYWNSKLTFSPNKYTSVSLNFYFILHTADKNRYDHWFTLQNRSSLVSRCDSELWQVGCFVSLRCLHWDRPSNIPIHLMGKYFAEGPVPLISKFSRWDLLVILLSTVIRALAGFAIYNLTLVWIFQIHSTLNCVVYLQILWILKEVLHFLFLNVVIFA